MKPSTAVVTLSALLAVVAGTPARADEGGFRVYTVEPGDSCWSIALKLYGSGTRYDVIHRHNDLGPMPHLLEVGQKLRLPRGGAGPEATIRWIRREVKAKAPQAPDWREAREEMGLWRLYKVATGGNSSAGIVFEDRSELRMREEALLVIYGGAAALTRSQQRIKSEVVVEEGVVKGGLERLDRAAAMTVRTPSSSIDLRSRSTQIEVDRQRASIVSVYDGEADVSAQGTRVNVRKGQGTVVRNGGRPAPPRPLPAPPRWRDAGDGVVLVPRGATGTFEARWTAAGQAARFRVELARDRAFRFPLVDAVVGAGIRRFRATDLAAGSYYVRLATIERNRLEGSTSRVKHVEVLPITTTRQLRRGAKGELEAVGLLRIDPPSALDLELSVDGGPFQPARALRLHHPGLHTIHARRRGATDASVLAIRLLGVRGELELPTRPLGVGQRTLTPRGPPARGRPPAPPGLVVTAAPVGEVELRAVAPGVFQGLLRSAPGTTTVALRAAWAAGELDRRSVRLEQAREGPAPAPPTETAVAARAPGAMVALEWGHPALGAPARGARPLTALGLSSFVTAPGERDDADTPVFLRLALRGELALLDGRLGLDADLPWFESDVSDDRAGRSELGDLRIGARWVALDRGRWTLTPSLRVGLPTGGMEREHRRTLLAPELIAEWRPLERLTAGASVALPLQAGPGLGVFQHTAVGAGVRLWRRLDLTTGLDLRVRVRDADGLDSTAGLAAGGALVWQARNARLGLAAGAGLGPRGQELFGRFSAGLFVDLVRDGP